MAVNRNEATPADAGSDVEEAALPTEPAERKRVLNVLAQRRYRRRKKQKQAILESLVGKRPKSAETGARCRSSPSVEETTLTTTSGPRIDTTSIAFDLTVPSSADDSDPATSTIDQPWNEALDSWLALSFGSSSSSGTSSSNSVHLGDFLQEDDIENCTFSDDFNLIVTELGLLRAGFENALRIGSADRLWNLDAVSVFFGTDASNWALPENMQPTQKQLTLPHHPLIDILPWPSVRNKLIDVYSLPIEFWPKHVEDGETCTLVRLIYDMEDNQIRVWGDDPAAESAWEVDERFARAWWFILDRGVVRDTNRRRIARGEPPLRQIAATL